MSARIRLSLGIVTLFCIAAPRAAHAVGEVNGRIVGTVTEAQTGAPVPGATVTATSPSLIGGAQRTTTRDDGSYELAELPGGTYTVEVAYAGVKPIRRRVVVRQGETAPLNITWSAELAAAETTVVIEERHMTRPDSTQSGTVLAADSEAKVASGRRYQDIVLQVAGVKDVLPIGRAGTGNPQVSGGNTNQNRWLVDGLDITDPVTNTFSANINFDSIASLEVLTGGLEAQYNAMGGVFNLITAAGSDIWHVDSSFYIQDTSLAAHPAFGPNLYDTTRPFGDQPTGPQSIYQANLNGGGPILKHKLWFNGSFEWRKQQQSIPAGTPFFLAHPARTSYRYLMRLKLTYAPSSRHRLTLSISSDPATFANATQNNAVHPSAESFQEQGGVFAIGQWDYFISRNVSTNVQAGFQWNHIANGPVGKLDSVDLGPYKGKFSAAADNYSYGRSQHVVNDPAGQTTWYNTNTNTLLHRYTLQLDPSLSLRGRAAGYHDAKFGIQSRLAWSTNYVEAPGGGSYYTDNNGGFGEAGVCDADPSLMVANPTGNGCFRKHVRDPFLNKFWGFQLGFFAQDRWKPIPRLTILPGFRFDYGMTKNVLGETTSSLVGFGPRIGFTYDLTGDQKTIFSAYYGRSNEVMTLLVPSNAAPNAAITTYSWNPATRDFDTVFSRSGGSGGYARDTSNTLSPPHVDEAKTSIRREIFHNSVAGVEYTYRRLSNLYDGVEVNRVWDPSGYRAESYLNGTSISVLKYTTPDDNYRIYQALDVSVESRPTPGWDFYAAYTLSWLYGTGSENFNQINNQLLSRYYNNRQAKFINGYLREDQRHYLKLRGSYTIHGLSVGGTIVYASGNPPIGKLYFNTVTAGFFNRRTPQGTEPTVPNDVTQIADFRNSDQFQVNARISYDTYELWHQHFLLIVDIFNLFNLGQENELLINNDTTFGQVSNRLQAFSVQFGARYIY